MIEFLISGFILVMTAIWVLMLTRPQADGFSVDFAPIKSPQEWLKANQVITHLQNYAGGIKLDTLFIDEGFGSLDVESLDLAIRTLVDLQASGRMIGVISHVSELKEQMALRIDITAGRSGSHISTSVAA
jgi:hypothetical protein